MKQDGTHEGCIEQIDRLFKDYLYAPHSQPLDAQGRIRLDNFEMEPEVQQKIAQLWPQVTSENLEQLTDIVGYRDDFYRLFGFNFSDVNYTADVDPEVGIDSITAQVVV